MNSAVKAENIGKHYDQLTALHPTTFTVEAGETFGLIGPDGAGKTTLIRMLNSLLLPDQGTATVLGLDTVRDYKTLRPRLGYMPGRFSLYQDLSVEENLAFFATVFNTTVAENYDLIRDIYGQLEPFRKRRAGALSGGMKQKLALSCALIHRPEVLFLDEPTTGVDAVSRVEFWDMLARLKNEGITILVSTPYMDEAARCDKVALMQDGRILAIDSPAALAAGLLQPLLAITGSRRTELLRDLRSLPHVSSVFAFGEQIHYTDQRESLGREDVEAIRLQLIEKGHDDVVVVPTTPGIEDRFLALSLEADNLSQATAGSH